tara:strand:+ start:4125 stop:4316 length:192 start_codon:yes stop_codon:yes gene_type:complete
MSIHDRLPKIQTRITKEVSQLLVLQEKRSSKSKLVDGDSTICAIEKKKSFIKGLRAALEILSE